MARHVPPTELTDALPRNDGVQRHLIEIGRPHEAAAAFQQALRRHPNRTLSVLGLARAAHASGDISTARAQYGALLNNYRGADAGLPEWNEARAAISGTRPK